MAGKVNALNILKEINLFMNLRPFFRMFANLWKAV